MRSQRFHPGPTRSREGAAPRGFTLLELLVVVVIIVIVVAVAVPSIVTMTQDMQVKRAQSEVYAALSAARSRAIRDRTVVALHVFRDAAPVYQVARDDSDPDNVGYNQNPTDFRWGAMFDFANETLTAGVPHVPTSKLVLRLELPNPNEEHLRFNNPIGAIEFFWPGDHDPVILPDSVGVCRPETRLDLAVQTEKGLVRFHEDFYVVFGDDGKVMTVLVDYNLANPTNDTNNTPSTELLSSTGTSLSPAVPVGTWSASGLCLYDVATFRSLLDDGDVDPDDPDQFGYVNRADNRITVSPYTGLPITQEAKQ